MSVHALSRLLPVVLAAGLLAACATLPKHEIATTDVGSMRLEQVRVTFPENAKIAWPQAGEVLEKEEKAGRRRRIISAPSSPTPSIGSPRRWTTRPARACRA